MRATSNPPTPQQITNAVWDEQKAGHVAGNSFGQVIGSMYARTDVMARRTPYTYGPTNLAAGATYVPAAGTVVTIAVLDAVANDDFKIVHGAVEVMESGDGSGTNPLVSGYVGALYCDGTDVGIKNADAAGRDLSIEGFTI